MASARYALVAAKSRWEEQGFHFDDSLPNYGLEQFVYNRINELSWFRFARQPARANYNWVLEFYANNEAGEDFSMADVRVEDSAPPSPAEPTVHQRTPPPSPAEPTVHQRTPPPSPPVIPVSSHTTTASPATTPAAPAERTRGQTPDTPLGSTPSSSPPSPPAPVQSEEAALPLPFMLLRSQLQRIEARQMNLQEEFKVFQSNLIKFLTFQFPASATFFGQPSHPPPQPSMSAAAAAQPSTNTYAKEGATEEVHLSSDDENDIFDWQSPRDHLLTLGPVITTPAPAAPILSAAPTPTTSAVAERPTPDSPARKRGKATAGRTIGRDDPSSQEEDADQRPAKRRRRYHIITADSDDDDSSAELPVPKPMQSADPSLSPSI
ncbi:hypothetical protein V6N11_049834 [Hibiscus sabdariffa]|uniref:Uncharacterized protein n=1 Tax=Hibiscus sabdariffa TaxID=183260 RepID=A0ABR2T820_9ROSI